MLVVFASLAAAPAGAQASYYISKGKAESTTRGFLHYTLGYHHTVASCRPQGLKAPEAGYIYHRWVCDWAAGDSRYSPSCVGESRVRGSSDSGSFYWFVLYHSGKCPYGWRT
jgi:hypothetical protein